MKSKSHAMVAQPLHEKVAMTTITRHAPLLRDLQGVHPVPIRRNDQPEDVIEMLKADHKKVRDLLREYDAARQLREKWQIAEKIFRELELHTKIEEDVFYPAFEEATDREGEKLVQEALKDHAVVEELIAELRELPPEDEEFQDEFQQLRHHVEHHVREEEHRIFPMAQAVLVEQLQDLAEEMQDLKAQLLAS
jgi:hypothetical protein